MTVREAAPGKTARTRSRDQGRGRSDATNTVATRGRETLKNTSTARGARRSRTVSRTGVAGLNGFARDARWWSSSWAPIEFELARVRAVKAARNRKPLKRNVTSRVDGLAKAYSTRSHRPTPRGRVALVAPVDRLRSDVSGRPPRPGRPRSNGGFGSPRGAETPERSLDRDGRDG